MWRESPQKYSYLSMHKPNDLKLKIAQLAFLIVIPILSILSTLLSSWVGGTTFLNLTTQTATYWESTPFMLAVVMIWIFATIRRGLVAGVKSATLALLFSLIVATIAIFAHWIDPDPVYLLSILIFSILGIAFVAVGLAIQIFLFYSIANVFFKSQNLLRANIFVVVVLTAIATGLFLSSPQALDNSSYQISDPSFWVRMSTIMGCVLSGIVLSAIAAKLTEIDTEYRPNLRRFKQLAIAASCWGGESFYNLDLSRVNFRNADLSNTDLRAKKLYRTCFQGVTGLKRARVDDRYLDLPNSQVQHLLTKGYSDAKDFSHVNLRGAYLQNADLSQFNLTDAELTGADLKAADLRGSLLMRTQMIDVDLTGAKLTGCCVKDWSVNSQTDFTHVECDYVYREIDEDGKFCDRFPQNRDFESREFESLYQEVENVIELIFKEGEDWRAVLFSLKQIQFEDEGLGLELKGVERRGDRWVVKVTYNPQRDKAEVEKRLDRVVEEMQKQLAAKEQQINQILGIATHQSETLKNQSAALKAFSQKSFGNSFIITGSQIQTLAGTDVIEYNEASQQIRSWVANCGDPEKNRPISERFLTQLNSENVTAEQQAELIEQVLLSEAKTESFFKQFLQQQGSEVVDRLPETALSMALRNAIAKLSEAPE